MVPPLKNTRFRLRLHKEWIPFWIQHSYFLSPSYILASIFSLCLVYPAFADAQSKGELKTAKHVFASPPPPPFDVDQRDQVEDEILPPIEAKTYPVTIVERSNSGKIYLLGDIKNQKPPIGRILLLKQGDDPAMAFRVFKLYPDKKMIGVKRVKRYQGFPFLEDNDVFRAIEKITDIDLLPPTPQDHRELRALEQKHLLGPRKSGGVVAQPFDQALDGAPAAFDPELDELQKYDPELDSDRHFKNVSKLETVALPDVDPNLSDDEEMTRLVLEEPIILEREKNWLTAGFGYIRNSAPPDVGGAFSFSGGNVRFGRNIRHNFLFNRPYLQDSLTLEGGFYLFKTLNFAVSGDAYTVTTFTGSLRWNFFLSEGFILYGSVGLVKPYVISASEATSDVIQALSLPSNAIGLGMFFQVGPSWYIRLDLGTDAVNGNLVLRF